MTWTYTANPAGIPLDAVRLMIGDTDSTDPQLQDAELMYLLANASVIGAAAAACDLLVARYARQVDRTLGEMSLSASQRVDHYMQLAASLRSRRRAAGVPMLVGGLSVADKMAANVDTSQVQPYFFRGMWDAPGVTDPTTVDVPGDPTSKKSGA